MKTTIVFALVCISMSLGAVFQELPNPQAGEGKCISSSYPKLGELKYGESKSVPGECLEITCNPGGGVSGASCGVIAVSDKCKLVEDSSKPYPDCCPKPKC